MRSRIRSLATIRPRLFLGMCLTIAAECPIASAEAKWVSIDVTGSSQSTPVAINDKEVVTGSWLDNSGISHGFVRASDGTITSFDAAEEVNTQVLAINKDGLVAGYYFDFSGNESGFIRAPDGTITSFVVPNTVNTTPSTINGKGATTGYAYSYQTEGYIGFLRAPTGKIKTFQVPKSAQTYGYAIDDAGDIAGAYVDGKGFFHGFMRSWDGKFVRYSIPDVDAISLIPAGIDSSGDIAGSYASGDYVSHCFLRKADGTVVKLDLTGWTFCQVGSGETAGGISNSGAITGSYTDSSGNHGFFMRPNGRVRRLDYPGGQETIPVAVNDTDEVTGDYLLSTFEGFLWK